VLCGVAVNVKDSQFKEILNAYKKITVVGISPNASRASHQIAVYMKDNGYDVVGVNPGHDEIAGIKIYKKLSEVPTEYRKFVDVFRSPEFIPSLVDEILEVGGIEVLWLQLGITHPAAEKKAEAKGIRVISDRCLLIEHRNYGSL
jgi:uncharacterized protein